MNNNLKALLIAIFTLASGAVVWTTLPGVTKAQILDAGVNGCVLKDVQCDAFYDGGYYTIVFRAAKCTDAGSGAVDWVIGPKIAQYVPDVSANCKILSTCVTCDGGNLPDLDATPDQLTTATPSCICSAPSVGLCTQTDGGPLPVTGTYPASLATGPGCLPRVCNESSGHTSAPTGCNP